jgi:hypothetical protein
MEEEKGKRTEVTETKSVPKSRGEDCEDGCKASNHTYCVPLYFLSGG